MIKEAAAKKENEAHDTRNSAKDKMERKIPQQLQRQKAHLLKLQRKRLKEEARSAAAKMTTNEAPQQHRKLKAHLLAL